MNTFKDFVNSLTDLVGNTISGFLLTLAVAVFFFTVINFLYKRSKGADGNALNDAKNQLGWSIIGLFVIFSIWGIISFIQSGFFAGGVKTQIEAPSIRVNNSSENRDTKDTRNSTEAGSVPPSGIRTIVIKKNLGDLCNSNSECESNSCRLYGGRDQVKICQKKGVGEICNSNSECETNSCRSSGGRDSVNQCY
jgi:hypothetical protein